MNNPLLENVNIKSIVPLATPAELRAEIPQTPQSARAVERGRAAIESILDRDDPRFLAIVGPCSIHNLDAAGDYARRLRALADEVAGSIFVVMRVYFEKPRTTVGWKGLINDPFLNDTFRIEDGLRMARRFLVSVSELGLPAATEILDTLTPQYIGDLISWTAIGARTAEAQTHREIASGLSTPVGFKNGTDGSLDAAVNGIASSVGQHHFLGVTDDGLPCCAAAASRTTARRTWRSASGGSGRRTCRPTSWWTVPTPIRTSAPKSRGASCATSSPKSKPATNRCAASCWRVSSKRAPKRFRKTCGCCGPACP